MMNQFTLLKKKKVYTEKKNSWSTLKSHLKFQFRSDYMKKSRPTGPSSLIKKRV